MRENKKIVKNLFIIFVIIFIIIVALIYYKKSTEEFIYSNIIIDNEIEGNVLNEVKGETEEIEKIKVYVTGEVKRPGVIELNSGARIEDAIKIAGGITEFADLSKVNLAYCLEDEQKLYIPNINEKHESEYITIENGEDILETTNSKNSKVNINTSGIEELCTLSGVGEALAQRIIDYRTQNGKFKTIEDLKNVSGIGEKKFESLKEYVTIK